MVLEHALLHVKAGQESAFEAAMQQAKPLISVSPGFLGIEVRPASEKSGLYLLLVRWNSIADHRDGFRLSDRYGKWRILLHDFYEPMPDIAYFGEPL
jgi:heme-degrading monooxygenase HmoA